MKEKVRQNNYFRVCVASAGTHRDLCIVYHDAELDYLETRGPAFCTPSKWERVGSLSSEVVPLGQGQFLFWRIGEGGSRDLRHRAAAG